VKAPSLTHFTTTRLFHTSTTTLATRLGCSTERRLLYPDTVSQEWKIC